MFSIKHVLILHFILIPFIASARMSEKAIYSRCYAQLVSRPVPLNSPQFLAVKTGQKKAKAACLDLLAKGRISENGDLAIVDTESKGVLNTFFQLHRTWFPTSRMDEILGFQNEFERNVDRTVEFASPALTLTYSLFANSPYKNTLRGADGYYGVRENGGDATLTSTLVSGLNSVEAVVEMPLPAVSNNSGSLIGIRKKQVTGLIENYHISSQTYLAAQEKQFPLPLPLNIYQNYGGGILGQQAFFILNNGHTKGQMFDGALKMPRKWSKTIMESLMCLSLPALTESDIAQYARPDSTVPFRRSSSCITCHASMDMMAGTARHLYVGLTGPFNQQKTLFVGHHINRFPSSTDWISEGDFNFRFQNPQGRLMYRSFASGKLVDQPVQSIEDLGQKISESSEFYQCAAKRYFEFFTGISVSLYDRTNPANQNLNKTLTARDKKDRLFIESLGTTLKETQSLTKMIEQIIDSPYYRSSTFNPEEGS